jgi:hypothetical protein
MSSVQSHKGCWPLAQAKDLMAFVYYVSWPYKDTAFELHAGAEREQSPCKYVADVA